MPKIPKVILLIENSRTYGRGLLQGIVRYSRLYGPWSFYMEPEFYMESTGTVKEVSLSNLKALGADGIIMRDTRNLEEILTVGLPTIIATAIKEKIAGLPCILTDDEAIGKMAAEHLLDRGFRQFAYCGFGNMPPWCQRRRDSFSKRVSEAGYKVYIYKPPKSPDEYSWEKEQDYIGQWLKKLPKPVGLMACNDDRGRHVTEACKITGLNIPEQIAITGVDNDELVCEMSDPPLSSIALNVQKGGYEAAELLDKMMSDNSITDKEIVIQPTHIVTRRSSDILAIEDPEVAAAVQFIRENSRKAIQVSDVVYAAELSRRGLEQRFRKVLGRSIHDEIRRCRIEQIAQMLVQTNLTISQIAAALGYSGIEKMSRYFRREKGMSPLAYRKRYGLKV
jgi:LacI family transcriptional regulator